MGGGEERERERHNESEKGERKSEREKLSNGEQIINDKRINKQNSDYMENIQTNTQTNSQQNN